MSKYSFVDQTKKVHAPLFDLKYCSRCCMPETEEGYSDDEHGMCRPCSSSEQKMHIDWVERSKMLEEILDKCQKQAGNNYDCIVPISGGKDSAFQLHVLTKVYKLKVLAVTYSHNWFSKTGWYNLMMSLDEFNVDHIMFTPNRDLVNRIAKKSLSMIGDSCWSCHAGVGAWPLHVATKYNIPVIIYGESIAENASRGDYSQLQFEYDKNYYTTFSAKKTPDEMLCSSLESKDLFIYQLPTDEEYEASQIKIIHLGDFIFWDDERQMEFIRDTYDWKETDIENAYKGYKSAECIMPGVHDFLCYLKRGWARATFHASLDVRNGLLTRDEGFKLINSIDPQRPEVLDYYLKITGIKEKDFYATIKRNVSISLEGQEIPILPKASKNKEILLPYPEQLIREHRDELEIFELKALCFNCGLEKNTNKGECEHCANKKLKNFDGIKEYFKYVIKNSSDNYDCIVRLDDSWESAFMLHLIKNIYNLKPLVITFDKFTFSEVGWFNIVNCLESFNVDQIMFTPGIKLSKRLRNTSFEISGDIIDGYDFGLNAFIIKTACEFGIPHIIGLHNSMNVLSKEAYHSKLTHLSSVDYNAIESISDKLTEVDFTMRDIHQFSKDSIEKSEAEKLNLLNLGNYFNFDLEAKAFVEKYYGWKEDKNNDEDSFVEKFLEKNRSHISPEYIKTQSGNIKQKSCTEEDLSELSAKSMIAGYANKDFSPVDVAKAVISKIERLEPDAQVWEVFDADKFLTNAKKSGEEIQKNGVSKIMHGVPIGVKDTFNTIEFPTQMGSQLWKGFTPGNDARVVFNMIRAGGIVCGKTVTSEFAVHALNKTINPHRSDRTPGTSSSGSAVSIATGMVPISLGTQTGASIIRPASFCGVYGFKPSFGLIPRTGVLKNTDTLDNIGFFVKHAEDLENTFRASRLHGTNYPISHSGMLRSESRLKEKNMRWKIAYVKTHTWNSAADYAKKDLDQWMDNLSSHNDMEVYEINLPLEMNKTHEIHSVIYDYCLAYYFNEEFKSRDGLSERLKKQIEHGKKITVGQYKNALKAQSALCQTMDRFLEDYDTMISLSTAGEAPMLGEVENPDPGLMWTLTNLPALSVPAFISPTGMPFGLQIAARQYSDLLIIDLVKRLIEHEMIDPINNPVF